MRSMQLIAECGGKIKYGHSEVGNFIENGRCYEQNEKQRKKIERAKRENDGIIK